MSSCQEVKSLCRYVVKKSSFQVFKLSRCQDIVRSLGFRLWGLRDGANGTNRTNKLARYDPKPNAQCPKPYITSAGVPAISGAQVCSANRKFQRCPNSLEFFINDGGIIDEKQELK